MPTRTLRWEANGKQPAAITRPDVLPISVRRAVCASHVPYDRRNRRRRRQPPARPKRPQEMSPTFHPADGPHDSFLIRLGQRKVGLINRPPTPRGRYRAYTLAAEVLSDGHPRAYRRPWGAAICRAQPGALVVRQRPLIYAMDRKSGRRGAAGLAVRLEHGCRARRANPLPAV